MRRIDDGEAVVRIRADTTGRKFAACLSRFDIALRRRPYFRAKSNMNFTGAGAAGPGVFDAR